MADDITSIETEVVEIVEVSEVWRPVETVELVGVQGPPGPVGPPGPPGTSGDKHYEHQQSISSNTWVIAHGLGKHPSVICFDSAHDEIEGSVTYQGLNQVTVTFSSPTGGYAYLN